MKRGRLIALPLLVGLALPACRSGPGPAAVAPQRTASAAVVAAAAVTTISLGESRQRFDGWGAAVTSDMWVDPLTDAQGSTRDQLAAVDRLLFRSAGINLVRVFMNPGRTDDANRLDLIRRTRRYGVRFMLTGGGAPKSLVERGELKAGAERAYADALAGVLGRAEQSGAAFDWVAAGNEVELNPVLRMSSAQAAAVYRELARLIGERGLRARLVLGDNAGWVAGLNYVREAFGAPGVADRTDLVAAHPYRDDGARQRADFLALAKSAGRRVWMTEWTSGCPRGDCPDDPSIDGALRRFERIPTDLLEAGASAWFLFRPVSDARHGADDGIVLRTFAGGRSTYSRGKRFHAFRQFTAAGRPGSRVLAVRQSGTVLPAVAFKRGRRVALVVVNRGGARARLRLKLGSRRGRLQTRQTTATADYARLRSRVYRGRALTVVLAPTSATTFYLDR